MFTVGSLSLVFVYGLATAMGMQQEYEHSFIISSGRDVRTTGGSSLTNNPLWSIRSGDPNEKTVASFVLPLANGITLTRLSFSYRYTVGFGAPSPGTGTNFSLNAADVALYKSPHYNDYPYGHHPNYSLPVFVNAPLDTQVPASGPSTHLELHFDNNGMRYIVRLCDRILPCLFVFWPKRYKNPVANMTSVACLSYTLYATMLPP